jgi:hypothetical protein
MADTDLIRTKVKLALAGLSDAIASEDPSTPNHAARMALASSIADNLEQYTQRFLPRVLKTYPGSADLCYVDTLNKEVNCSSTVTQSTVDNQVIAIFYNFLALNP